VRKKERKRRRRGRRRGAEVWGGEDDGRGR
jgi:hypothetical protein